MTRQKAIEKAKEHIKKRGLSQSRQNVYNYANKYMSGWVCTRTHKRKVEEPIEIPKEPKVVNPEIRLSGGLATNKMLKDGRVWK